MSADIIIINGMLKTFSAARPHAEALAIHNGRIVAVSSTDEIRGIAGPATQVIDAQGNTVLPGFYDAHVHLFGGAAELDALNLTGVVGEDDLAAAVRAYARTRPEDRLVYAVSGDYGVLGAGREITRQDLDRVMPGRPFAMMAADHHNVWANTAALEMAGLLDAPDVGAGAEVVRAADGTATGELRESAAFGPILALTPLGGRDLAGYVTGEDPAPPATPAQRATDKDVIARGLAHCAAQGITTLHNMDGNVYQMELLEELEAEGRLLCRVQVPCHLKPHHDAEAKLAEARKMRARWASDWLWSGRVKMFMDGVIDAYTAFMLRPYPGRPNSRGEDLFQPEAFNEVCIKADAMGLQIAVHAIGDAAVRRTLDGFAAARAANGNRDSRHRIEHIESTTPEDLPRFAELGVIASPQPLHSPRGGFFPVPEPDTILHEDQLALAFPSRALIEAGAHMIFSTDWPVVPVDVMPSVKGAVATKPIPGWPDQSVSLDQALAAYIPNVAWAEFTEDRKGKLAPGFLADIVVMSENLETLAPEALDSARAVTTIAGGRVTYQA